MKESLERWSEIGIGAYIENGGAQGGGQKGVRSQRLSYLSLIVHWPQSIL